MLKRLRVDSENPKNEELFQSFKQTTSRECILLLLDKNANAAATLFDGRTALHVAARYNSDVSIFQLLLERKADANAVMDDGRSVIHEAVRSGCPPSIIRLLLLNGANSRAVMYDGRSVLHEAAHNACEDSVFKLLLSHKANALAMTNEKYSVLHEAVRFCRNASVIKLLLEYRGNPNAIMYDGRSILHEAVRYDCQIGIIQLLLDYKADPNCTYEYGSVLHAAVRPRQGYPNLDICRLLLHRGAVASAVIPHSGHSVLHYAIHNDCKPSMIRLLLDHGANSDEEEMTKALRHAILNNANSKIFELLLQLGANVNAVGVGNWPMIHTATFYGHSKEIIQLLFKHGANPFTLTKDRASILHLAANPSLRSADKGVILELLSYGVDASLTDLSGMTAGDIAAHEGNNQLARLLREFESAFRQGGFSLSYLCSTWLCENEMIMSPSLELLCTTSTDALTTTSITTSVAKKRKIEF